MRERAATQGAGPEVLLLLLTSDRSARTLL